MPQALKIFVMSMVAGGAGGWAALRVGSWIVERYFPREPMAFGVVLLATGLVAVASAVTSGVVLGKNRQ